MRGEVWVGVGMGGGRGGGWMGGVPKLPYIFYWFLSFITGQVWQYA